MEYKVFVYEGDTSKDDLSRRLAVDAVKAYCSAAGIAFDEARNLMREGENGKPYMEGLDVGFNVSHSGLLWMCMVGPAPCGLDLQVNREINIKKYNKIIQRYFTPNEQDFCERYGIEGFFRIWTHREAFGKFTGRGFYGQMPDFVGDDGLLKIEVDIPGTDRVAYVKDEPIAPDIFMAYCTEGEDDHVVFTE